MKHKLTIIAVALLPLVSNATVHTVQVSNSGFTPNSFVAACNDTVTWVWSAGSSSHTATSTSIPLCASTGFTWNVALHANNPTYSYVIPCGGVFNYQCNLHPSMTGSFTASCATGIGSLEDMPGIINMYPNPFSDKLNIEFSLDQESDVSLIISDLYGKEVASFQRKNIVGEFKESVVCEKYPAGVYFISLTLGNKKSIRKAVHY